MKVVAQLSDNLFSGAMLVFGRVVKHVNVTILSPWNDHINITYK